MDEEWRKIKRYPNDTRIQNQLTKQVGLIEYSTAAVCDLVTHAADVQYKVWIGDKEHWWWHKDVVPTTFNPETPWYGGI